MSGPRELLRAPDTLRGNVANAMQTLEFLLADMTAEDFLADNIYERYKRDLEAVSSRLWAALWQVDNGKPNTLA